MGRDRDEEESESSITRVFVSSMVAAIVGVLVGFSPIWIVCAFVALYVMTLQHNSHYGNGKPVRPSYDDVMQQAHERELRNARRRDRRERERNKRRRR